jgi:hypothetical protein
VNQSFDPRAIQSVAQHSGAGRVRRLSPLDYAKGIASFITVLILGLTAYLPFVGIDTLSGLRWKVNSELAYLEDSRRKLIATGIEAASSVLHLAELKTPQAKMDAQANRSGGAYSLLPSVAAGGSASWLALGGSGQTYAVSSGGSLLATLIGSSAAGAREGWAGSFEKQERFRLSNDVDFFSTASRPAVAYNAAGPGAQPNRLDANRLETVLRAARGKSAGPKPEYISPAASEAAPARLPPGVLRKGPG